MFLKAAVTSGAMFETRFNSGEGREAAELACWEVACLAWPAFHPTGQR